MKLPAACHIRRLHWPRSSPRLHEILAAMPGAFAGLLEDPTGNGRQFLISRRGQTLALYPDQSHRAGLFFDTWRHVAGLRSDHESAAHAVSGFVYAAYEAGGLSEVLPPAKTSIDGPLLWLHVPEWSCCLVPSAETLYISAASETILSAIEAQLAPNRPPVSDAAPPHAGPVEEHGGVTYEQLVRRVRAYIAAGDIFQANIARFWSMACAAESCLSTYQRLRRVNPAPFSAYVDITGGEGRIQILSASPERLFSLSAAGWVDTRPIAGTRGRGHGRADAVLRAELLLSEKERAEHIMLVDLERNDLGRVCRAGSIEVNERMVVESYATVQHIVSNVHGRLATGKDMVDVFQAMFPGGTITGCPKLRCMEIIRELEPCARGPYTGSMGYMAWDGSADMNILIRTLWHHKGRLHWAAGAGIVADSEPASELRETEHKAAGLLRALPAEVATS